MALDPVRKIYTDKYYRAKQLLLDKRFQDGVKRLKAKFTRFDCPIPQGGLKDYQQFLDWHKKYGEAYSKVMRSEEYKKEIERLTGGKEKISFDELQAVNKFKSEFLPEPYGYDLEKILEECDADPKDKELYEFTDHYVFFDQEDLATSLFNVIWKRNSETDQMELFIQILGNTRKEDITEHWDQILQDQKLLPDYKERNVPWENFERDNRIYNTYLELKKNRIGKRANKKDGEFALDDVLYQTFAYQYPSLTLQNIRDIIKKVRRFRGVSKGTA